MYRCLLSVVPVTAAIALIASCQASSTPQEALLGPVALGAAGPMASSHSTVRLSLAGLRGWRSRGRHLSAVDGAAIVRVRLTGIGPGIAVPIVATAPFAPDAEALPTIVLAGEIAITLPAGNNRVFTLEGLDANGREIAIMRTLGSLGGGSQQLVINANTDAAARVLASLLVGPQGEDAPDTAGIAASLSAQDLTTKLLSFVNGLTQFDAAANTYDGAVPPVKLRDRLLADLLRSDGRTVLDTDAPAELHDEAGSTVPIRVVAGGVPVVNAEVTLYDPVHSPVHTDGDGQASFTSVPPGTWTLVVKTPEKTLATTIVARDQETAALRTIDLAPAEAAALAALLAVRDFADRRIEVVEPNLAPFAQWSEGNLP